MKKTRVTIRNPNTLNTKEIIISLKGLRSLTEDKFIYLWADAQTHENRSFNIQKGLITKLSSQELPNIALRIVNSAKELSQNYNITSELKKININYRII